MAQQCPLIFRQIDATVTKLNTIFVVVGLGIFFWLEEALLLWFLVLDFILRLWNFKRYSLLNQTSLLVQKIFKLPVKMADAGGKRLAAFFGLIFMLTVALAYQYRLEEIYIGAALVYVACALLDIFFNICIACIFYSLYFKILKPKEV